MCLPCSTSTGQAYSTPQSRATACNCAPIPTFHQGTSTWLGPLRGTATQRYKYYRSQHCKSAKPNRLTRQHKRSLFHRNIGPNSQHKQSKGLHTSRSKVAKWETEAWTVHRAAVAMQEGQRCPGCLVRIESQMAQIRLQETLTRRPMPW